MDLLDLTRLLVASLYLVGFIAACYVYKHVETFTQRVSASVVMVISFGWALFYFALMVFAPLDTNEILVASLVSRVIHLPTIAAGFVLLFTAYKAHVVVVELQKDPKKVVE